MSFEPGFHAEEQILDEDGRVLDGETPPDLDDDVFVDMYKQMRLCRQFDKRAVSLQRQGRMGTYSTMLAHEGALVGSAFALRDDDWIVPYYRDHGATVTHGLGFEHILQYYMGHEEGSVVPEDTSVFPICITIGDQIPHATGAGMASKLRDGDDSAVVCYFGDGATSEGDFHEGLNFAGVFDTPNVFFCLNNQWAISTPIEKQTAASTLAQKASGYGFDGVRVDGMDPLAVYEVTRKALETARDAESEAPRPTLVEALLYRIGAHNTSDDPSNYRQESETEPWRERDPISRMETFLRERGLLSDERIAAIEEENTEEIESAVEIAEAYEPDPDDIFEHVFDELPDRIEEQRAAFRELHEQYGDEAFLRD
ncbi:pyruvate dehydrogenase (acetyl-transferring) E1 component subunit alpha [Natronorubrum texcoconense]|uniref:Pyruvate dehydrogenase E1 component alpha subunit n=1 Tax=Natronorubrum texcoconense TaxID=1095776 RepID=A0A1G9D090_9EURY|nr:pyruvate dehydrogenase (acetyl-transferring) E1 component subunit alpha [Natronorubrum texcoconense]SDK57351.1 pyruvate dehydrogenase E1 component alpha subunit [Natronorubrum texcoconense]